MAAPDRTVNAAIGCGLRAPAPPLKSLARRPCIQVSCPGPSVSGLRQFVGLSFSENPVRRVCRMSVHLGLSEESF